jgi:hypothetical protein
VLDTTIRKQTQITDLKAQVKKIKDLKAYKIEQQDSPSNTKHDFD